MDESLVLKVEGMHCAGCVRNVQRALAGLTGVTVQNVEIGTAVVLFDPERTAPDELAAAITAAGYPATPLPPSR